MRVVVSQRTTKGENEEEEQISEIPSIEDSSANSHVSVDNESTQSSNGAHRVHLRVRYHNGNTVTILNGIDPTFSCLKILKAFKKVLKYMGEIVQDYELGQTIQVERDHRKSIATFLVEEKIANLNQIKVHRPKKTK
ncbi:translation factor SUI1-like protein [Thalictrum thalictroides]|uniref:Translation factor SUI1-like protein n=1 Tax=Thalictrum thalictroides TaxID=46969 RepID=A0A7J6W2D8_THATH|nr:translation factor SUI1-like protein [Thalictrum thalictroides]